MGQFNITVSELLISCLLGFPIVLYAFYQLLKWTVVDKLGSIHNSINSLKEDIRSQNDDIKSQGRQIVGIDNRLARLEAHNEFSGPLSTLYTTIEKRKA